MRWSTRLSAGGRVHVGKRGGRRLIAELFRAHGEQFDKGSRGTVGLHELLSTGDRERCLQLAINFGENQRTARQRPVVEGREPRECLIVVTGSEP
jgi:hypothetical protein